MIVPEGGESKVTTIALLLTATFTDEGLAGVVSEETKLLNHVS